MQESKSKTVTICDNCKTPMKKEDDVNNEFIKATLSDSKGKNQNLTYCSEECLRQNLNNRSKKRKSKASSNILEIDITNDARYISTKERNKKSEYFLDEKHKSFPIENCEDVKAAVRAWVRYKGEMSFDEFKTKLTRRAHELGCSLPDLWGKDNSK